MLGLPHETCIFEPVLSTQLINQIFDYYLLFARYWAKHTILKSISTLVRCLKI